MTELPDGDTLLGLLGSPASAPALHELLKTIGALPLPAFAPDDAIVSYRDLDAGYEIQLRDAGSLPTATALASGTPVLFTAFFYSGLVSGYGRFAARLPRDLSWADTEHATVAKMGPASLVTAYKDTGSVRAQRWTLETAYLTASFTKDGALYQVSLAYN